ncbi:DUF4265 domain-containing protein [Phaeobacter sp. C3_T13_0]|uniref:DUF4265 domain-containing protein n=1 Tax=Phaeobacter cretensis TaxID=3342641 RepID=UPI0039BD2973
MTNDTAMEKVHFNLGPGEWHSYETESVWASDLGGGVFRLENTPFFAKGANFEDSFTTELIGAQRLAKQAITRSGRSTYRISLIQNEHQVSRFEDYWSPMEKLGCRYEHGDFGFQLFAVDVPASTDVKAAYALLERGEQNGIWDFEEGHCAHGN